MSAGSALQGSPGAKSETERKRKRERDDVNESEIEENERVERKKKRQNLVLVIACGGPSRVLVQWIVHKHALGMIRRAAR